MKPIQYVAAILALSPSLLIAEQKVTLESLPQAVQVTVKRETANATIKNIIKEKEHGKINYEIESTLDGKTRNLDISPDGSVTEVEDEVDLAAIPTPARTAFEAKAAGATIQTIEKVTSGSDIHYEAVIVKKTGKTTEFAVNQDGTPHH